MAKAKTINDVVAELEALNTNLNTLLTIEQREERRGGGVAGQQRVDITTAVTRLFGPIAIVATAVATIGKLAVKIIEPIDTMQVYAISSGRSLLGIIDQIKDQKLGFIGGITENAKMQSTAFKQGFDLQDHNLREQLTLLERDGQQGSILLGYTNSLVRQGIPRDVAHDMLKNLAGITLTNTQSAATLNRMLSVMAGVTPALTQLGFGDAPQQVLAELSKNLPDLQALDLANVFKDIMTANQGGEMGLWVLGGGKEASEELKAILLNIEKTGKATPDQLERVKEVISTFAKDSLSMQKDIGVGLAGEGMAFDPMVLNKILEGSPMADLDTTAKLMGAISAVGESNRLHGKRLRDKESHIFTTEQSLRMAQRSLVHVGELMEEFMLRAVRTPGRTIIDKNFGGLFDRLNALNAEVDRRGELNPGMREEFGLGLEDAGDFWELISGMGDPYEPPEGEEDPVTGTTQEAQLTALESIQMALGQMAYDAGMTPEGADGDIDF